MDQQLLKDLARLLEPYPVVAVTLRGDRGELKQYLLPLVREPAAEPVPNVAPAAPLAPLPELVCQIRVNKEGKVEPLAGVPAEVEHITCLIIDPPPDEPLWVRACVLYDPQEDRRTLLVQALVCQLCRGTRHHPAAANAAGIVGGSCPLCCAEEQDA